MIVTKLDIFFFFQAEDGIRDVERSRGLGDVYKRQDYRGICLNDDSMFLSDLNSIYIFQFMIAH